MFKVVEMWTIIEVIFEVIAGKDEERGSAEEDEDSREVVRKCDKGKEYTTPCQLSEHSFFGLKPSCLSLSTMCLIHRG